MDNTHAAPAGLRGRGSRCSLHAFRHVLRPRAPRTWRAAQHERGNGAFDEASQLVAEERRRLARELHDGVVQGLWVASMEQQRLSAMLRARGDLELCQQSELLVEMIDAASRELRAAIGELRDQKVDGRPLVDVLTHGLEELARTSGCRTELQDDGSLGELDATASRELARIGGEALTNIRKHAEASTVRVVAVRAEDGTRMSIIDDGRGFVPGQRSGLGIVGMRERARRIGGRLRVESSPGGGSRVTVVLPRDSAGT